MFRETAIFFLYIKVAILIIVECHLQFEDLGNCMNSLHYYCLQRMSSYLHKFSVPVHSLISPTASVCGRPSYLPSKLFSAVFHEQGVCTLIFVALR